MAAINRIERTVFLVSPRAGGWAVAHDGGFSHWSTDKAEACASANRLARQAMDHGQAVQVRIDGELGYR